MKRVLITGIGGYVGSCLAKEFLNAGWEVDGWDNWAWSERGRIPFAVKLCTVDVTDDLANFPEPDEPYDLVVHCAAFAAERLSRQQRHLCWRTNVIGTGRVAHWCRVRGFRLVHISTGAISADPPSPYSESKLAAERIVQVTHPSADIIRLWCLFGPGQLPHGTWRSVFAIWAAETTGGRPIVVLGGDQTRAFTWLPSLRLAEVMMEAPGTGRRMSLGCPDQFSLIDVAELWSKITGAKISRIDRDEVEPLAMGEMPTRAYQGPAIGDALEHYWGWWIREGLRLEPISTARMTGQRP